MMAVLTVFVEGMNVLGELSFSGCLEAGSHVVWVGLELTENGPEILIFRLHQPLQWLG